MLSPEAKRLREDGYVILERQIDDAQIARIQAAIAPYEAGRAKGRNDFEGKESWRVYSLAGKDPAFIELASHPRVCALLDEVMLPNWLLSNLQSIRLHPGETAQPWHADDGFYRIPRPRHMPYGVSAIWAIEEFTADNGATEVIPGSHLWGEELPAADATGVQAVMPAGSVLVFDAAAWHRGRENRSTGTRLCITPQYCQPFFRPQESQLLIVPPDKAKPMSDRARSMLGYNIHPPFVGQVEGMHPLRLVDPDYRAKKGDDHMKADSILVQDHVQYPGRG